MRTKYRLGIDAGGTFTDLVLADRSGDVRLYKALSTPADPTRAIEEGMRLVAEDLGESPAEIVSNSDLCINGTTVGLNALIQHKGGKTGLICTAGHEDSIEIRLGHKEDGYRYDPEYPAAVMLVPRYLRKGVRERVISDGSIRTPLNEDDVRDACRFFIEEGVEAVAISFVWSVLNQSHERRAAEIVRELMPQAALTVGSELYPQVREYTRTSTAVVNAYLAPILSRYVAAVDEYFRKLGREISGPLFPVERRTRARPGDLRAIRLCHQFRTGLGAAGRLVRYRALQEEERHHHRYGRHVLRHHADAQRRHQHQQEHRYAAISDRHSDDPGRDAWRRRRLDRLDRQHGTAAGRSAKRRRRRRGPPVMGKAVRSRPSPTPILCSATSIPKDCSAGRLPLDLREGARGDQEHRRSARHIGRAGGLWHVHDRQQQHGQRHPPGVGGARLRSARFRAGRRRRRDWRPYLLTRRARWVSIPSFCRSSRRAFAPSVRSSRTSSTITWRQARCDSKVRHTQTISRLFEQIEAQGVKHLVADGFAKSAIRIERSLDMRYVGQVHECTVEIGNFADDAKALEKVKECIPQTSRGAVHLFRTAQRSRGRQHRKHALRTRRQTATAAREEGPAPGERPGRTPQGDLRDGRQAGRHAGL